MILTSFATSNFKSIGANSADIVIAPFTVLVGENGAGKTSLLEALAFINQRTRNPGKFSLEGEFVRFSSHDDYVHGADKTVPVRISATFAVTEPDRQAYAQLHKELQRSVRNWGADALAAGLSEAATRGLSKSDVGDLLAGIMRRSEYLSSTGNTVTTAFTLYSGGAHRSAEVTAGGTGLVWRADNNGQADGRLFLGGEESDTEYAVNHPDVIEPLMDRHFRYVEQGPPFTLASARDAKGVRRLDQGVFPDGFRPRLRLYTLLEEGLLTALRRVYYLPAPRGRLASVVPAGEIRDWVGHSAEDLARFLTNIQGDPSKRDVAENVRDWAKKFGIDSLNAASRGRPELHLDYVDDVLKVNLGAQGLGYGSSQVLPIIAQGFASEPGSILLIEEPEVSLHPNAQITLLDMFAELVRRGKRLLITTHSATLLMGLGRLLEGTDPLKPEQIAVYEATKTPSGSVFGRLKINKAGFIHDWVGSFGHAEKQILESWIKSVPEAAESD